MSRPPQASVIVPTRDRPDRLAACLAALAGQTAESFEIIVVDDGSIDAAAVRDVVAAEPRARLVRADGRGPAAARNHGAAEATAPVLAFTDDDCRPAASWIEELLAAVEGGAAAVAGVTRNGWPGDVFAEASQTITNHLTESSLDEASGALGFAPTCNLATRAEVVDAIPFDETFPTAAGEDRDWCRRLAESGTRLQLVPTAVVHHHQVLSAAGYWRQQLRYGRGAHRWFRTGEAATRPQPPTFYLTLLRKSFGAGVRVGVLVVLAQVATAVGIVIEAVSARRTSA